MAQIKGLGHHLHDARVVAEAAQIVRIEPADAAEFCFCHVRRASCGNGRPSTAGSGWNRADGFAVAQHVLVGGIVQRTVAKLLVAEDRADHD